MSAMNESAAASPAPAPATVRVPAARNLALRRVWVQVHLWLGLTLGVVGALLGLTGSLLVFDHAIHARLNPQRYATTGTTVALPYAEYARLAAKAVGDGARTGNLRLPQEEGMPVVAFVRPRDDDAPMRRIHLDPPTGRVLDAPTSGGLIGWAHDIHGSLKLREYSGREMVGVIGIAMLVSSLSGLYLWWPRRLFRRSDFAFRPGFSLSRNLHYTVGLYGALLLAILSFTGIVISFPEAGRAGVGAFAALSPPLRGVQAGLRAGPMLDADAAAEVVRKVYQDAAVVSVGFPQGPRGTYRVAARTAGDDSERGNTVVFVDPRSGAILRRQDPSTRTAGDAFLAYQRPLHEGSALGLPWRLAVFAGGLMPALLVVTGTVMWLRTRRRRR